jgi:hypothetical protein
MNLYRKTFLLTLAGSLALGLCVPAVGQQIADTPTTDTPTADVTSDDQTPGAPAPQKTAPVDDKGWHLAVTPYLWFAGVHGTVGALGHTASVHASATDVLSKFNIGLMGEADLRKGRFLFPVDFMWIKLSDDKAFPGIGDFGADSIKAKTTQTLFTPKAGYLIVNSEKFKAAGLVGLRYWHLGQNLSLEPAGVGVYQSANWVDVVAGGRFEMALSPKAAITIAGDAGGGGANSEYQVVGLLAYKIKPKILLQGGWRYLDVNYKGGSQFIYDTAQSGLLLGVTINLK